PLERSYQFATEFARRRLQVGQGGSILALGGAPSVDGRAGAALTGAAESAIETLVRSWAVEWAIDDIRANFLSIGFIEGRPHPGDALAREQGRTAGSSVPLGR